MTATRVRGCKMVLYTIGYEGLSLQGFLGLLNSNEISLVADVRRVPSSRKKGFSKTGLKSCLADHGIKYLNFRKLGTSKEMRDRLKDTGDYDKFFEEYKSELADQDEQLQEIATFVSDGKKVALLCFEKDAYRCHRRVIADEIKRKDGNGLKIRHVRNSC